MTIPACSVTVTRNIHLQIEKNNECGRKVDGLNNARTKIALFMHTCSGLEVTSKRFLCFTILYVGIFFELLSNLISTTLFMQQVRVSLRTGIRWSVTRDCKGASSQSRGEPHNFNDTFSSFHKRGQQYSYHSISSEVRMWVCAVMCQSVQSKFFVHVASQSRRQLMLLAPNTPRST